MEDRPSTIPGVTWGTPWGPGVLPTVDRLQLTRDGRRVPMDGWTTAQWPDGSVKWSAHAIGADDDPGEHYLLGPALDRAGGADQSSPRSVAVTESADLITVDTGTLQAAINRAGSDLISRLTVTGTTVATGGRLVSVVQSTPPDDPTVDVRRTRFTSMITSAEVESAGDQRVTVKITGRHRAESGDAELLQFVVRLYFYAGAHSISMTHTVIWDGDEHADFLAGLGIRFDVALTDALHDRHVQVAGALGPDGRSGFLTEGVRGLTGLRRDPGAEVRASQVNGQPTPAPESWNPEVSGRLDLIPAWDDYTLSQLSSDGFTLRKRTAAGYGWVPITSGGRSTGMGYLGGAHGGGLAVGLRDFWQSFPTQVDIRDATTDTGQLTVRLYSPEAPAMDLRFYHDGMGQDTHAQQLEGLEITYEDYEPGFGTPCGVARTSQLTIWAYPHTPAPEQLAADSMINQTRRCWSPARRICTSRRCSATGHRWTGRTRPGRRWRTGWTTCSTSTPASASSDGGTASGTTATSCAPTTRTATSGATTSAASPGTTPSCLPTCGCGTRSCAPGGLRCSGSLRR